MDEKLSRLLTLIDALVRQAQQEPDRVRKTQLVETAEYYRNLYTEEKNKGGKVENKN